MIRLLLNEQRSCELHTLRCFRVSDLERARSPRVLKHAAVFELLVNAHWIRARIVLHDGAAGATSNRSSLGCIGLSTSITDASNR